MPHQCVHCGKILDIGSREILEGCADCHGKFFFYIRDEQVKKVDPQTAVIMMTGYVEEDLVRSAIGSGAYAYLYKPLDMKKVITVVEAVSR